MSSECRSCGAPVEWVSTEKHKVMPLDEDPVEADAGFLFTKNHATINGRRYRIVTFARGVGQVHLSHFATCPTADTHRG